jgi:hypothetical protein
MIDKVEMEYRNLFFQSTEKRIKNRVLEKEIGEIIKMN